MGYYAGYEASLYPVDAIAWDGLTHVAVAFYLPNAQGALDEQLSIDPVKGPALGHAIVDAAHKHGKKAIASIGGGGLHDPFAAAAKNAHAALVASIAKVVNTYGYDGVDLDWEPIQAGDAPQIASLVKDLKTALPSAIFTIPITPLNHNLKEDLSYLPSFVGLFDQINLMTYGMAGAYQGWKSWHSSPLHWNGDTSTPVGIDDSVDGFLAAGADAKKLGVGAGFYGQCYSAPVVAPVQALGNSTIVADDGVMSYDHIMTSYWSQGAYTYDAKANVPWLHWAQPHGPKSCTYVTYEDSHSIMDKGVYVRQKALGGLIIWTIGQQYRASAPPAQQNELLDATRQGFLQ
jgi:chitinase